jgi:hypothetical protein
MATALSAVRGLLAAFVSLFVLASVAYAGQSQQSRHGHPFLAQQRLFPPSGDHLQLQTETETEHLVNSRPAPSGDKYLIGVGKADITGPVVEIGFAGYADLAQKGSGLRQRLYSRAFIIGDVANPSDRIVYIVLDVQSGDTAMRYGILEALADLGDDYAVYGSGNIAVTGTHSHSGPGAWFNYLLPQITSFGFDKQSYQAIVDGAVLSIKRAHESLEEVSRRPTDHVARLAY